MWFLNLKFFWVDAQAQPNIIFVYITGEHGKAQNLIKR
jgi:hypothetical protein